MSKEVKSIVNETNHNLWTLSKHVAKSINNTAAKVDVTVYGNSPLHRTNLEIPKTRNVIQKIPSNPPSPMAPSGVAILIVVPLLIAGIIGYGLYKRFR